MGWLVVVTINEFQSGHDTAVKEASINLNAGARISLTRCKLLQKGSLLVVKEQLEEH